MKRKDRDTFKMEEVVSDVSCQKEVKLDRNLKESIGFCNKVVIHDLPGSTFNECTEKQPNCTGTRREWETIREAVNGDCPSKIGSRRNRQ